jgi:IS5 family transposase
MLLYTTAWAADRSQALENLLEGQTLYADSAYTGQNKEEAIKNR